MTPVANHRNRQISVDQTPLIENALETTRLTADANAASGTITVENINGFAISQILIIGELGQETAELVKTHAATAPTGTTITLAANTVFAHAAGTPVYRVEFDQLEISHADTLTGAKSVLSTASIQPDQKIYLYTDTTETAGYYFARFKETIGNTFSGYSDGVPYGGWASTTVGYAISWALARNNTTLTDTITRQFCYEETNDCLDEIQGKLKRHPHYQSLDTIIGQSSRGVNVVSMPTGVYDRDTNKSLINVRIGSDLGMVYYDPEQYEEYIGEVKKTQVRTEASAAGTTLEVDNSYDFADSGTLTVYISGTEYAITYTAVTRDDAAGGTAVFTGIPASGDGAITVTIPVDTNVWQDEDEGEPQVFTIRNQQIEFYPLCDSSHDNQNIYSDFWTQATAVDSDGDTLDATRFDMVKYWLAWKIRMMKERDGDLDFEDGYYLKYKERLNDYIRTLVSGFVHRMKPKLNTISYHAIRTSD